MTDVLATNPIIQGAYFVTWAFFAYGPQLVLCLGFAWFACRRTKGDLLNWMAIGFLWSLLPIVGPVAMWWTWRRAVRDAGGTSLGRRATQAENHEP